MTACRLASGEVENMKRLILGLVMGVLMLGLTGCEDDTKEKARELTFENQASVAVAVIPLVVEWGGFMLPPGQTMKLKNIRNPDYRYEPKDKVTEGSMSKTRNIVFVDTIPVETPSVSTSLPSGMKFDNKSKYTVHVTPRTIEYGPFSLRPGERVSFRGIKNPEFDYQPKDLVSRGSMSTDRSIVFINTSPNN